MHPEHLDLLQAATTPSITPDGSTVVVSVIGPDLDADAYRGGLWAIPTDGGPARRLTNGPTDTSPTLSPDGSTVAFLRSEPDSRPQIHLTRLDGGEPVCLTDQAAGAGAPVWSPDGRRLVWSARVPEPGRYGTEDGDGEKVSADAEPPRLVTEFRYRMDNLGYVRDRRLHVFVADVPDLTAGPGAARAELPVEPRQLTDGDADDVSPAWSPDGASIVFLSSRHDGCEDDLRSAVHIVAADLEEPNADPAALTAGDLSVAGVTWLGDGRLALLASDVGPGGRDFVGRPTQLWVTDAPVAATGSPAECSVVTDEQTVDLEGGNTGLVVVDGRVLVRGAHRGTVHVLAVDPDGSPEAAPETLVDGAVVVTGHAVAEDGTLVVTARTADRVGDVGVVDGGDIRWVSDVSRRLRDDGGVVPSIDVVARSGDGHEVHGWVLLPDADAHGAGPHPVLLNIHGGPFAQYDAGFFDEAQVSAGAGYAVVMCNPRGSAGYGFEHGRSIRHAMGTVDADDVVAFLDHVLAETSLPLDADRVGVMGGSYGGYMTALLTTRTDRFAAAIVERGYLDASSFVGSSDIGWFFPGEYHGSEAAGVEQSPMPRVDQVTTPTLVIHSESDWRTPIEQGQRWFTALKLRGVPTELLIFPAESHELSRSGRPKHRRARFEHILRWWSEHLPVG